MRIDVLTTFPDMFDSVMGASMMRIAQEKQLLEFYAHDLRDWTHDRHRTTDDDPYGGGHGLIMKCEPIFEACDELFAERDPYVIFLAPTGERFTDEVATELSGKEHLAFICGHYEGIDERAYTLADRVLSIGDYVLTSGELASMVVIDAVVRKIDGVLGDALCPVDESFSGNLLEYPQYTRPASYRGLDVPEVLLSGNHAAIAQWRRQMSLARTALLRPDLLKQAELSAADCDFLQNLEHESTS